VVNVNTHTHTHTHTSIKVSKSRIIHAEFGVKLYISSTVHEDGFFMDLTKGGHPSYHFQLCKQWHSIKKFAICFSPDQLFLSHCLSFTSSQNYSCYRKAAWRSPSWTDLSLKVLTRLLRNFASRVLKKQTYSYFWLVLERNFLVSSLGTHWLLLFTTDSLPAYNSKGRK
jgi:hypothetical protein